jgi:hypothetical protein
MLGQDSHTASAGDERRTQEPGAIDRVALADACRDTRQRLEAVVRALQALVADIDRTLERGSALPEDSELSSGTSTAEND